MNEQRDEGMMKKGVAILLWQGAAENGVIG
jgi:hypothetical protein